MQFPLVSIIIPSYNYGSFISQTLDSLLAQSYQNWEAIIIDDGSNDETKLVVNVYLEKDPRFSYIYQSNQGPSAARNAGLKKANGAYLHFLDADDLLSKDKIAAQVSFMEQNTDCDISYTESYYFEDKKPSELFKDFFLSEKIKGSMLKINARGKDALPYWIRTCIFSVNAALVRTVFVSEHKLYFDESFKSAEDRDFWLRCTYAGASFRYFNHALAYALIRVHTGSASQNKKKMHEYDIKIRYAIKTYLEKNPGLKYLEKINNKYLYGLLYKDTLWKHNLITYAGVRYIIKQIGWVDGIRFIIRELNVARKTRIT